MRALQIPSSTPRAILLATIIAVTATGCQLSSGAAGPGGEATAGAATIAAAASAPSSDAPVTLFDPTVQVLLSDLRAARARHDARAFHEFRHQLTERLGAAAVDGADAAYRQVLSDLVAAEAFHDYAARARYRLQLRALCDPAGLTSALEPCETDLAAYAD